MWFFPIGHPPRSPETMIRFSQTILDKQNSSQGIAGWTPESSTRTFFFFFLSVEPRSRKEGNTLAMKVFMTQEKGRNRKASS